MWEIFKHAILHCDNFYMWKFSKIYYILWHSTMSHFRICYFLYLQPLFCFVMLHDKYLCFVYTMWDQSEMICFWILGFLCMTCYVLYFSLEIWKEKPKGLRGSPQESMKIVFHALLPISPWKWSNSCPVCIRFGHPNLGDWQCDCGPVEVMRYDKIGTVFCNLFIDSFAYLCV